MAKLEALSCTRCEYPNAHGIRKSFLGLRRFSCHYCQHANSHPASRGMITFCWVLVGLMGLISINAIAQGGIPVPGGLGIAAVVALWVNSGAKRRVEQERRDYEAERHQRPNAAMPPPLPRTF